MDVLVLVVEDFTGRARRGSRRGSQEEEKVALMGLKVLVKHWENWGSHG